MESLGTVNSTNPLGLSVGLILFRKLHFYGDCGVDSASISHLSTPPPGTELEALADETPVLSGETDDIQVG